ncbi:MAG: alkaline phosphatase family protein [Bacteroidaceae bacterium]
MKKGRLISPLLAALAFTNVDAQTATAVPRIVINITIDQLRSDYMEAFMPLYGDKGFRRLMNESRIYEQAEYPISRIDRASAIASIVTGTTPYNHGIVSEQWLDRQTLRPVYCVDDAHYKGLNTTEQSSPIHLGVSTLGDELKVATDGKAIVYAIAPFRDAAVLNAGHAANAAIWINDETGAWCSSSFYGVLPSWVTVNNEYQALGKKINSISWQPSSELVGNFNYFPSGGMKKPFHYKFKDIRSFRNFKTSGLVNEQISSLTEECLRSTTIGTDGITDYLSLTFYAGNYEHKPANDHPMELQDIYVRLDKALGNVIDAVESKIGKDAAIFVITSTGYTDEETSDLSKYRIPTGTFYINRTTSLLNMYLIAVYGQGNYVEACLGGQIYLNHKLLEQKQLNLTEVMERAQDFLIQNTGVKDVYSSHRLQLGAWTPGISRLRNSYNTKCSGDIMIEVAPGWRLKNEDTKEEILVRESFVPFPIFFYGFSIKAERISTPVTVDCIAPTLANAMRIRAPNACSAAPLTRFR